MTLYGIANCDSCRKARRWLRTHRVEHGFHDLRVDGIARDRLESWVSRVGWETLLNRRSATWRQLDGTERQALDAARAVDLMLAHPTLIRRPVLESGDRLLVGFHEADYRILAGQ